jgi:hypothetical protein
MPAVVAIITVSQSTTIQVNQNVKERLRKRGEKGQTYNEIIENLLDTVEELETETETNQ